MPGRNGRPRQRETIDQVLSTAVTAVYKKLAAGHESAPGDIDQCQPVQIRTKRYANCKHLL